MVSASVASGGGPFWPPPDAATATLPIVVTVPAALVRPSGRETVTASPTLTNGWRATLNATSTVCWIEVACRTGCPGCANIPVRGTTAVTRIGPGMYTTSAARTMPVVVVPKDPRQGPPAG